MTSAAKLDGVQARMRDEGTFCRTWRQRRQKSANHGSGWAGLERGRRSDFGCDPDGDRGSTVNTEGSPNLKYKRVHHCSTAYHLEAQK